MGLIPISVEGQRRKLLTTIPSRVNTKKCSTTSLPGTHHVDGYLEGIYPSFFGYTLAYSCGTL
jgi:hypothetical protein